MSPTQHPGEVHTSDLDVAVAGVRALILDADGVLLFAGQPLPGAVDALLRLEVASFPYRVVTNFSSAHRRTLAAAVSRSFGIPVDPARLITAASAAAEYTARHHRGKRLFVLASPDALGEWEGQHTLTPDEAEAEAGAAGVGAVVLGDAGDDLSFRNLNIAFRAIRAGAAFVAMHRNPWWVTAQGVTLDAGALVAGLEYSLGRRAIITGKPSRVVFREAGAALAAEIASAGPSPRLRLREIAMVGDDLKADVAGSRRAGLRGILVLSGKTGVAMVDSAAASGRLRGSARPDAVAPDVGTVVEALLASR